MASSYSSGSILIQNHIVLDLYDFVLHIDPELYDILFHIDPDLYDDGM
jgi:hypothetical protein